MPRLHWIGTEATAKSSNVSNLTCVNAYPEVVESRAGKCAVALYGVPGLTPFVTLAGDGGVRGFHTTADGRFFGVCGATLTEIAPTGGLTVGGTLNTAVGPVSFADNGTTLILVDGPFGYTFTYAGSAFAQIVDAEFLGASHVGFLDGYYVLARPNTQQFYWSDLYSAAFTGTNIASAEGSPDLLVALLVAHREIWLFGRYTTEVWYSTGQAGADAFARIEGALLEHGCLAPHSPAIVGESLCWLAQNKQGDRLVVQTQGMQVVPISTHTLTTTLQAYGTGADAIGWSYQQGRHVFYVLTFPSQGVAHVYDLATGLWHRRQSWNMELGQYQIPLGYVHGFAHGRHYVGNHSTGAVYILDEQAYTDAGTPIVKEVVLPPVFSSEDLGRVTHAALQLDIESGVGLDGAVIPGSDPSLELSYSDDGGHVFHGTHHVPMGRIGEYRHRARVRRLGMSRDRRYRVVCSEPTKFVVLGAVLDT
jgi:hypothetical protein